LNLRRSAFHLGIALTLTGLLWVDSALAELPRPDPVPDALSDFKPRSASLVNQAKNLDSRIQEHDARCSHVPRGSAQATACAGEMHELEAKVGSYIDSVKAFNRALATAEASAKKTERPSATRMAGGKGTIAPPGERKMALQKKLVTLRSRIQGIQEALKRLDRSIQLDAIQHEEWQKATNEAFADAVDNSYGLTLDVTDHVLDSQLETANTEIRGAVDKLAGETDSDRREQIHGVLRMMEQNKTEIKAGLSTIEVMKNTNEIEDAVKLAKSDAASAEKAFRAAYMGLDKALNDPTIQAALKIGKKYGQVATYSKYIVDSGYDISAEAASWQRINQLDKNSDAYLAAAKTLGARMEDTMKQIKKTQEELQKQP
jgi:prefoldin subunit 5